MSSVTGLIIENGISVIFCCVLIAVIENARSVFTYVGMILPLFYAPFIVKWLCVFFGMKLVYAQILEIGLVAGEVILGNYLYDRSHKTK